MRLKTLLRSNLVPSGLDLAMEWLAIDADGIDEPTVWLDQRSDTQMVIIDTFQRVRPASGGNSVVWRQLLFPVGDN